MGHFSFRATSLFSCKRLPLLLLAAGLAFLPGCGGGNSSHTAFVTLPQNNKVGSFRINDDTGQFTKVLGSPFDAGPSPASVVVHPSNNFLYVANQGSDDISLFTIDSRSGELTEVTPRTEAGADPVALALSPSGNFLFALNQLSSSISVYSVDAGSGALSEISGSPFSTFQNPIAMTLAPSGNFLYIAHPNLSLVSGYSVSSGTLRKPLSSMCVIT